MARILYTSISAVSRGRRRPGFIDAPNLRSATEALLADGHRDLRFHSDPNFGDAAGQSPEVAIGFAAPEGRPSLSSWISLLGGLVVVLGAAGSAVLFAARQWELAVLLLMVVALGFWSWIPLRLFHAMRRAMSTRRYDQAARLLAVLRFVLRGGPAGPVMRDLLVTEEAKIVAGSGQMQRALEVLGRLRDGGPAALKLHEMSLPTLYDHAQDYEGLLGAQRELAERVPDEPNDVAWTLALPFGAYGAAREALELQEHEYDLLDARGRPCAGLDRAPARRSRDRVWFDRLATSRVATYTTPSLALGTTTRDPRTRPPHSPRAA